MPRVNLRYDQRIERERDENLIFVMRKYRDKLGVHNWEAVAGVCGMSPNTFCSKRKNPGKFTRNDLRQIKRGLKIPDEEIRPYL